MKRHTPALTAEAIAAAASKKTARVQRQLAAAEAELQHASSALIAAAPAAAGANMRAALAHNVAAEQKVHSAAEDLEAVKELLSEAEPNTAAIDRRRPAARVRKRPVAGNSGEGTRSLIPHLRKGAG